MLIWNELIEFMGAMQRRLVEKEADPKKRGKSWQSMSIIELEEELRHQVLQLGYAFRQDNRELIGGSLLIDFGILPEFLKVGQ